MRPRIKFMLAPERTLQNPGLLISEEKVLDFSSACVFVAFKRSYMGRFRSIKITLALGSLGCDIAGPQEPSEKKAAGVGP